MYIYIYVYIIYIYIYMYRERAAVGTEFFVVSVSVNLVHKWLSPNGYVIVIAISGVRHSNIGNSWGPCSTYLDLAVQGYLKGDS